MAAPQNFRTAFNGFNREDVVHYLEYINTKHNTEINKLTSDAESLRAQLDALRSRSAVDLQSLVDSLRDECAELKAQLEEAQAATSVIAYGAFIQAIIEFLILALVVFFMVKFLAKLAGIGNKEEPAAPAAPTTKVCPFCKSEIAIDATRCPHCTSELKD